MIPKIIHISWKNEDIFNGKSFMIKNGLLNLIKLNPDWEIKFANDEAIEQYLQEELPEFDYLLIKDKNIIEKNDLWRLIKLYKNGGLYIDLDRFYNIPLSEIVTEGIDCVLPTHLDHDFSQDLMLSAPGNPIFFDAINLNLQRRRMGWNHIYALGPQTYMNAVTKNLTGSMLESSPGKETMNALRTQISNTGFAKTYREVPWKDTLVFKTTPEFDHVDYELEKRLMYEEFKMHHWTGTF
jgi:mannosyltransferase OCH1-like enzyme